MDINFKSHSVLQLYFTNKISEKQVLNQHFNDFDTTKSAESVSALSALS